MSKNDISRRQFIRFTAAAAGSTALLPFSVPAGEEKSRRTARDIVPLGKTGLNCSRLGFGTGSQGGSIQRGLGQEGFNRLLRYAYDQGILYIDTSQSYETHEMIRKAIEGLPREKLFIQSKMSGMPEKPLEVLDRFRKELNVDYIDSLLTHCATTKTWVEDRKRVLDALETAKEKKIIRAHGVSCHSLPALTQAARHEWVDVNLVRINPQGAYIDTPATEENAKSDPSHLDAVVEQIKTMRAKGHGVIGMKIIGNGDFIKPEDREKSFRFAMQSGLVDVVVIGFKTPAEIDEAIQRIDEALANSAT